MHILFQLIIILAVAKYSCKAGFFENYKGIFIYAALAGIVAIVFYPIIITMGSNAFEKLLANKKQVADIAVVITIEAISGLLISIAMLNNLFVPKKRKWLKILKLVPGVLIIASVFYIELSVFKSFVGYHFYTLAIVTAITISAVIILLSWMIKALLPENATRYELKFLINCLLLVFAILLNAGLADYNQSVYSPGHEYLKLVVFSAIVLFGFLLGWFMFKRKNRKLTKQMKQA